MLPGKYRRLLSQMEELKWSSNMLSFSVLDPSIALMKDFGSESKYWPEDYPFRPPRCVFQDKIWNPYVDFKTGQICIDILGYNFSPALTTIKIIFSIISLMSESKINESNEGYLNTDASIEMLKNTLYFKEHAKELSEKHSFKRKEIYTDDMRGIQEEPIIEVERNQMDEYIENNRNSEKYKKKTKFQLKLQENIYMFEQDVQNQSLNQNLTLNQTLTDQQFNQQVEKLRKKYQENLQLYGTIQKPSQMIFCPPQKSKSK